VYVYSIAERNLQARQLVDCIASDIVKVCICVLCLLYLPFFWLENFVLGRWVTVVVID